MTNKPVKHHSTSSGKTVEAQFHEVDRSRFSMHEQPQSSPPEPEVRYIRVYDERKGFQWPSFKDMSLMKLIVTYFFLSIIVMWAMVIGLMMFSSILFTIWPR